MRACVVVAAWLSFEAGAQAEALNPAEAAFERGRQLVEANLHAQACAAFELSQRLDPQLGTKFNLAGCYVHIGKIATAWQLYKELSRSDSNAQRRAEAGRLALELEARIATVRVRARAEQQSSDLRVFVGDTEVTSLLDVDIPFDPGHYVISASSPGHQPFLRKLHVEPKEVAAVDVELEREPAPSLEPTAPPKRSTRVLAGKITLAAGAGLMAFGAFAAWRWHVNTQEAEATGSTGSSDRALRWGGTSAISFFIGAVGTATGGVLLSGSSDSRPLHVAPAVGSGAAALLVNGAF